MKMTQMKEFDQSNGNSKLIKSLQEQMLELSSEMATVARAQNKGEQKVSTTKKQLETVYGKKFFEAKN